MFRGTFFWCVASAFIAAGALTGTLVSCSASLNDEPLLQDAAGAPVLVHLRTRGRQLTLTGTGSGVRYSTTDDTGRALTHLTLEELEGVDQELYELAKSATASQGVIWAGRSFYQEPPQTSPALPQAPSRR